MGLVGCSWDLLNRPIMGGSVAWYRAIWEYYVKLLSLAKSTEHPSYMRRHLS